MSDATRYTPENDAVDWSALADQLFPAEVLGASVQSASSGQKKYLTRVAGAGFEPA